MTDRNLLLQEVDILDPKTCEVDGIEYSLIERAGEDFCCDDCAGWGDKSLCEHLGDCSFDKNGTGWPASYIWIKKELK